ncbi:unnamed protein product [Aureobasidium pullulans]|nr:unnamed protein product [Aureobasidium pullulans]
MTSQRISSKMRLDQKRQQQRSHHASVLATTSKLRIWMSFALSSAPLITSRMNTIFPNLQISHWHYLDYRMLGTRLGEPFSYASTTRLLK